MESWRISNTMWLPKISSPLPTVFPYNPSLYSHWHLCSADGKREETPPGQVGEPWCCPWENIDLKLTDLNCLTEETEGNPSIKYGILIIWSIYFNDLKAKPAGLVTASKRYREKTCSLNFHPVSTGDLWTCAHSGLMQGRRSVLMPMQSLTIESIQLGSRSAMNTKCGALLKQFQIHWKGYYLQIILRHVSFLAITILQRRQNLTEEQNWAVILMVKSRGLCNKASHFSATLFRKCLPFAELLFLCTFEPVQYGLIPMKNSGTLRGKHYINVELLCY